MLLSQSALRSDPLLRSLAAFLHVESVNCGERTLKGFTTCSFPRPGFKFLGVFCLSLRGADCCDSFPWTRVDSSLNRTSRTQQSATSEKSAQILCQR